MFKVLKIFFVGYLIIFLLEISCILIWFLLLFFNFGVILRNIFFFWCWIFIFKVLLGLFWMVVIKVLIVFLLVFNCWLLIDKIMLFVLMFVWAVVELIFVVIFGILILGV